MIEVLLIMACPPEVSRWTLHCVVYSMSVLCVCVCVCVRARMHSQSDAYIFKRGEDFVLMFLPSFPSKLFMLF
jgi:hypothetical protein